MRTAILVDGGYFIKRFRAIEPNHSHDAHRAAECIYEWAQGHLYPTKRPKGKGQQQGAIPRRELYRIFFYDCPPLTKKLHNPLSKRPINFADSPEAEFRSELHRLLSQKRKVAMRLGHLSSETPWTLPAPLISDLLKGKRTWDQLVPDDVIPAVRQKGVDMRIGIDIASLAYRRQVDQIVLFSGDADFVPAAKLARREGIDFVLDPMWRQTPEELNLHIDGLRSTCPKPKSQQRTDDPPPMLPAPAV